MIVLSCLAFITWLYLVGAHGRFWSAGPMLPSVTSRAGDPDVAVVIPARNEAPVLARCLASLLAQDYAGRLRIVLVDDCSVDGTGDVARTFQDPRLIIVSGLTRPGGWSGKLWAVSQGLQHVGDAAYVLLTDADIHHEPTHLATLVSKAERDRLDLVSEMVELRCASAAERMLVPAFVFFFQLLYPFARVNTPRCRLAAAAGGTMLVRATALARIGGINSIRDALIDDVMLAAAVKRGGPIWLGHSALATSLRPYPHAADIWRMISRTAYVQLRYSPILLLGTITGMGVVWVLPVLMLLLGTGVSRWVAIVAFAISVASYVPTLSRFRLSPLRALLLPAIGVFYTAATIGSAVDHYRGRGVVWKQRSYQRMTS